MIKRACHVASVVGNKSETFFENTKNKIKHFINQNQFLTRIDEVEVKSVTFIKENAYNHFKAGK